MADFKVAMKELARVEGGYKLVNNQNDRGGETFCGISRRWNPKWEGWELIDKLKMNDDQDSRKELVRLTQQFYLTGYWNKIQGDQITSQTSAEYMFKDCVLSGLTSSVKQVQKVVGVTQDGKLGTITLTSVNAMIQFNERIFLHLLALDEIVNYTKIVRKHPEQDMFFNGWVYRTLESVDLL